MNKDEATNRLAEAFNGLVVNKQQLVKELFDGMEEQQRIQKGLLSCMDSVIENPSEANLRKMVKTTMNSLAKNSETTARLCVIAIATLSFDSFDSDVAKLLMRIQPERSQEILQNMMRKKMGGDS